MIKKNGKHNYDIDQMMSIDRISVFWLNGVNQNGYG